MANEPLVRLSKLLSLMLRHQPEKFSLTLDAEGLAPLEAVVHAAQVELGSVTEAGMRANYGHSIAERIAHVQAEPPEILCHGTHESAVAVVLRDGLAPMKRQFVHLTSDRRLAARVGARRGKPVLLDVNAGAAHRDGVRFYRANEAFWLADAVPARYLSVAVTPG